jgi:hypothetical protein
MISSGGRRHRPEWYRRGGPWTFVWCRRFLNDTFRNKRKQKIHTLKLRGQARLSWREVRGQRSGSVSSSRMARREKGESWILENFLARRTTRRNICFTAIRLVVFMHREYEPSLSLQSFWHWSSAFVGYFEIASEAI